MDVSFAFSFSNTTINVLGMKAVAAAAAAEEPRSHNNTKFALKETASRYIHGK